MEDTTFCIWRGHSDKTWHRGQIEWPPDSKDPDGSEWMLSMLDGNPNEYKTFAESYYERSIRLDLVDHIYQHAQLTDDFVRRLNPKRDLCTLANEVGEIGYPG